MLYWIQKVSSVAVSYDSMTYAYNTSCDDFFSQQKTDTISV